MPGSGPRCHDPRHRLIAPLARRGTLLPPLHRHCPGNAEGAGNAGDHAKLSPSTAAATTKSRPRASVRRRQPRPTPPPPPPPPPSSPGRRAGTGGGDRCVGRSTGTTRDFSVLGRGERAYDVTVYVGPREE